MALRVNRSSVLIAIWFFLASAGLAANKSKPTPVAVDAVQEILKSETRAETAFVDRRGSIQPATQSEAPSDSEWWQAGYVQAGTQWIPFEESMAIDGKLTLLNEYQSQRKTLSGEPHGQWRLATWCRKNELPDQERVHLLRVLESRDPTVDSDTVFERLGCKKVGNAWVSPQDRREVIALQAEIERSHKQWGAKLTTLAGKLQGSPKQRAQAEKEIGEIKHFTAAPVVVDRLCMANRSLAEYGVKILGQIPGYQGSRALAGQATFSPWKPIRTKAIELLKNRKLEEFAPDLLLLLSNPIRPAFNASIQAKPVNFPAFFATPDVRINFEYMWIEETHDTIRVGIRRLFPSVTPPSLVQIYRPMHPQDSGTYDGRTVGSIEHPINGRFSFDQYGTAQRTAGNVNSALLELVDQKDLLDFTAEAMNDRRVEINERVATVLSQCSSRPMSTDPKVWWDWWTEFSSVAAPDQKNVVIVDERKDQPDIPSFTSTTRFVTSCLIAGTPIWTERGSIVIEQILAGDRVLSKDVTTGELNYKPVLVTTVRKPTAVRVFRVGGDMITASLGHHFWVSGEGWTKMRNLTAETPLHTVTGMQRVTEVKDEGREETVYNLVVADFHTYFVGNAMVLSHDVTTPILTNVKVPGLAQ